MKGFTKIRYEHGQMVSCAIKDNNSGKIFHPQTHIECKSVQDGACHYVNYINPIKYIAPVAGFAFGFVAENYMKNKYQKMSLTKGLTSKIPYGIYSSLKQGYVPENDYVDKLNSLGEGSKTFAEQSLHYLVKQDETDNVFKAACIYVSSNFLSETKGQFTYSNGIFETSYSGDLAGNYFKIFDSATDISHALYVVKENDMVVVPYIDELEGSYFGLSLVSGLSTSWFLNYVAQDALPACYNDNIYEEPARSTLQEAMIAGSHLTFGLLFGGMNTIEAEYAA